MDLAVSRLHRDRLRQSDWLDVKYDGEKCDKKVEINDEACGENNSRLFPMMRV